jgi:excisionase family DNA binding protein
VNQQRNPHLVPQQSVLVTPRIAALLEKRADLPALRVLVRGRDPEASAVLEAIGVAASTWRRSSTGTDEAVKPELAPRSEWLSTSQAGSLLGISVRAVVKAIHDERLPGHRVGDRWRISREDMEQFKAARAAG